MQNINKLAIFSLITAVACIPYEGEKETGEDDIIDTEEEEITPLSASVSWGGSDVSLSISNGNASADYWWGIVENTGACLAAGSCWTGEDCYMGYDLTSGGNYTYCHPVSATGGSLAYGASADAVAEGMSTVFADPAYSTVTTHLLDNAASTEADSCWVWGADTSYYNGYDKTCVEM